MTAAKPLRIVRREALRGPGRSVRTHAYASLRYLLAEDGLGLTVTDIVLAPGIEETYGGDHHLEVALCIEGRATATDLATGEARAIGPGTMWAAEPGARFRFLADEPTRLICVFTPPFAGHETGIASGGQPD